MEEYSLKDSIKQNDQVLLLNQTSIEILKKIIQSSEGIYILGQRQNQLERLYVCLLECQSIRASQHYSTPNKYHRTAEENDPTTKLLDAVQDLKLTISKYVDERIIIWNIFKYIVIFSTYTS